MEQEEFEHQPQAWQEYLDTLSEVPDVQKRAAEWLGKMDMQDATEETKRLAEERDAKL